MRKDSRTALVFSWAWSWEEVSRNTRTNRTESGIESRRTYAQLQWKRTHRIPPIQCFGTKKQRKRKIVFTLQWRRQYSGGGSSHDHIRHSAQYLRSSSGHVRRAGLQNIWLSRTYRWTCCSGQSRNYGYSHRIDGHEQIASDRWDCARRTNIRKSSRSSSIDQVVLQCWYHEDCGDGTVFHDPRRCGSGKIGGEALETLRNRDHDPILIKSWNLFLGYDREWNQQIRDGDDRGDPRRPGRGPFLHCYGGRTTTTRKHLGSHA